MNVHLLVSPYETFDSTSIYEFEKNILVGEPNMRHLTLPSTSLKKIFSGSQRKSHHAYDNGLSFFFFR